jgi:hypothetical protein
VPAGRQRLTISHRGGVVGVMLYQVCDECRRGLVGKVSIDSHLQGLGLGTRLVERAFRAHPGYAWHTTAQYTPRTLDPEGVNCWRSVGWVVLPTGTDPERIGRIRGTRAG